MNLKRKFLDRKGYLRERSIESLKNNMFLEVGDIVKVAETGYFYDIKESSTSISLNNGLFAEVKQNIFLKLVTDNINKLIQHINTMASPSQTGHISSSDKSKLDGIANNANNYSLPPATTTNLGGIIVGDNLSIDNRGRLSAESSQIQVFGNRNAGYAIFPGGYIEQWLYVTQRHKDRSVIKFPIPFPNDCLNIIIGRQEVLVAGGNDSEGIGALYNGKESFILRNDIRGSGFWMRACGY